MKTGGLLEEQEEGLFLNNISNSQLPRDRKGVSGETTEQRADEWKDEGEKGLIADGQSEEEGAGARPRLDNTLTARTGLPASTLPWKVNYFIAAP